MFEHDIVWTLAVLGASYACILYFCIYSCSTQLSLFHLERCSRNTIIIIIKWDTSARYDGNDSSDDDSSDNNGDDDEDGLSPVAGKDHHSR